MNAFLRWTAQPEDGRKKPRHYPNIDRSEMVAKGYVAARSGHTRGSTVDLTLYHLDTVTPEPFEEVNLESLLCVGENGDRETVGTEMPLGRNGDMAGPSWD